MGDITNDAFIKLKDAEVNCSVDKESCKICMNWGDKIPYESLKVVEAVGNSANAAVSASRLGLPTSLISYVGDDKNGEDCIKALEKENVDVSFVEKQKGKTTNYHYVLSFNAERTILVKHEAFNYSLPKLPDTATWLYLSSVGEAGEKIHDDIANMLRENKEIKLAFQPGTFQMKLGYERLKEIYKLSEVFVCNKEEAKRILETKEGDMKKLLESMKQKGPNIVVITDGPNGAYAYNGEKYIYVPQYPDPKPPLERTGAGDAFTSALTSFLIKGKSLEEALLRAPINSMSVVQYIGAQEGLLSEKSIEEYLDNAPENYLVKEF